jgi:transposase InsO family protein
MAPRLILYRKNLIDIAEALENDTEPKNPKITPDMLEHFELTNGRLYNDKRLCVLDDDLANRILEQEYRKHSVMGLPSFYRHISHNYLGITRKTVYAFLSKKPDFQLSRPLPHKRTNKPHLAKSINEHWCLDLADFKAFDSRKPYMMTVIDTLSRYVWAVPLRNKEAATVAAALQQVFTAAKATPKILHNDNGGEFDGEVAQLCKDRNIKQVRSRSYTPESNPLVEGVHRILRQMLNAEMVRNRSRDWSSFLPKVLKSYNGTTHAGAKHTPDTLQFASQNDMLKSTADHFEKQAAKRLAKHKSAPFAAGDVVRRSMATISSEFRAEAKLKGVKTPKLLPVRWSGELYKISRVLPATARRRIAYSIRKLTDGKLVGKVFFANELQLVAKEGEPVPEGAEVDGDVVRKMNKLPPEARAQQRQPRQPRQPAPAPQPRARSTRAVRRPRRDDDFLDFSDNDD